MKTTGDELLQLVRGLVDKLKESGPLPTSETGSMTVSDGPRERYMVIVTVVREWGR